MKNNYLPVHYDENDCGEFISTLNSKQVQSFMNYYNDSYDPISIQIAKGVKLTLFPETGKVFINDKTSSHRFILTHMKLFESFLKNIS